MTDEIIAYQGELMLLGWKESHNGGRTVTFLLPEDDVEHPFKPFTVKSGKVAGQRFMAVLVQIDDAEQPVQQRPKREQIDTDDPRHPLYKPEQDMKPYGKHASELYKNGFFLNPKVLEKIGSDEEFLAWVKSQPCCAYEMVVGFWCKGDVVAAHVRRVANGAGTGIKPTYSAIALCDAHHQLQHQKGESAISDGDDEWFDRQRASHVTKWASHKLANMLGHPSMGFVPSEALRGWAMRFELLQYLPGVSGGCEKYTLPRSCEKAVR